jgi:hypothetical protein
MLGSRINYPRQDLGYGSALFPEVGSWSTLEWKAGTESVFQSKFRSFIGSKWNSWCSEWKHNNSKWSLWESVYKRPNIRITLTKSRIRIRIRIKVMQNPQPWFLVYPTLPICNYLRWIRSGRWRRWVRDQRERRLFEVGEPAGPPPGDPVLAPRPGCPLLQI